METEKRAPASGNTGNEEAIYTQESGIKPLDSGISAGDVEKRSYRSYVEECSDLLMKYGTDRYGEKHQPLLVTILDVRTRDCPEYPPLTAPTPYGNGVHRSHRTVASSYTLRLSFIRRPKRRNILKGQS